MSQENSLLHQEQTYFSVLSSAYSEPQNFQEAWHHKDQEERKFWYKYIRKVSKDMINKVVWANPKGKICLQIGP